MFVLFTANEQGGIIQFIIQILSELTLLKCDVRCFLPEGASVSIPDELLPLIVRYKKIRTLNLYDSRITAIKKQVKSLNPKYVWYCDGSILCFEMILRLKGSVKQILTLHDAGHSHIVCKLSLIKRLQRVVENVLRKRCTRVVDYILVLSEESRKEYCTKHPKYSEKTVMLTLGAHIPSVTPEKPAEIQSSEKYFLFFGRIDKYKGLYQMLRSYQAAKDINRPLIIAGKGEMTEDEMLLCSNDKRIILLNRCISDNEMIYLFQNAEAVILPYIEATQSGIIPIAYKFSIPVITSDVKGLTQFVEDGETGIICHDLSDYVRAYRLFEDDDIVGRMKPNCYLYYDEHMNWRKNLKKLLLTLELE